MISRTKWFWRPGRASGARSLLRVFLLVGLPFWALLLLSLSYLRQNALLRQQAALLTVQANRDLLTAITIRQVGLKALSSVQPSRVVEGSAEVRREQVMVSQDVRRDRSSEAHQVTFESRDGISRNKLLAEELKALPVFIIASDTEEARRNVQRLVHLLSWHGLQDVRWWNATDARGGLFCRGGTRVQKLVSFRSHARALTETELAARDSLRRLLLHAWDTGIERFMLLQEDAMPHCRLKERLAELLQAEHCGTWGLPSLASGGQPGDVLMLDATYNATALQRARQSSLQMQRLCYDATADTIGGSAVLLRRDTFPAILSWLEQAADTAASFFGPLSQRQGFRVQVAYPSLFVSDIVMNASSFSVPLQKHHSVEEEGGLRIRAEHWNKTDYCGYWPQHSQRNSSLSEASWQRSATALSQLNAQTDSASSRIADMMPRMAAYNASALSTLPTVILTLQPDSPRVRDLVALLQSHGLHNVEVFRGRDGRKVWGGAMDVTWSKKYRWPGEYGIRQSYRELLKGAWSAGLERLMVLEDDVIPTCDLGAKLREALEDEACGRSTLEAREGQGGRGGILLLGATEYSLDWSAILDEVEGSPPERPLKRCYTCTKSTRGSYATIYSRSAIPFALRWLEEVPRAYDKMWLFLQMRGIHVRVMYPNIFFPDLKHESSTNPTRQFDDDFVAVKLKRFKWDTSLFCNATGE